MLLESSTNHVVRTNIIETPSGQTNIGYCNLLQLFTTLQAVSGDTLRINILCITNKRKGFRDISSPLKIQTISSRKEFGHSIQLTEDCYCFYFTFHHTIKS